MLTGAWLSKLGEGEEGGGGGGGGGGDQPGCKEQSYPNQCKFCKFFGVCRSNGVDIARGHC